MILYVISKMAFTCINFLHYVLIFGTNLRNNSVTQEHNFRIIGELKKVPARIIGKFWSITDFRLNIYS